MAHLLQLNIPLTLKTNNMNNEFTPYEQALDLKKLGFNEECLAFYNSTLKTPNELLYPQYGGEVGNWNVENHLISAPLYQQAFRWFIEKYNFVGTILGDGFNGELKGYYYSITEQGWINYYESIDDGKWYDTYEETELACLIKLIEIVQVLPDNYENQS